MLPRLLLHSVALAFSLSSHAAPTWNLDLQYQLYSPQLSYLSLVMSSAAYSSDPGACFVNSGQTGRYGQLANVTQRSVPQPGSWSATWSGFVGRLPDLRLTVVVYRGTVGNEQLVREILNVLEQQPVDAPIGGKVQAYFAQAQSAVWSALEPAYRALRDAQPRDAVLVTGHSLGAAMAALSAVQLMLQPGHGVSGDPPSLALYTFGEPRLGDGDFAGAFDLRLPNSWRVVHGLDPVVHLPPCRDRDGDCDARAAGSPYHHGTEVFYPPDGAMEPGGANYRICLGQPQDEDRSCADSVNATLCLSSIRACLDDHLQYFGIYVSKWWLLARCYGNSTSGAPVGWQ